jgi:hypothetical protein
MPSLRMSASLWGISGGSTLRTRTSQAIGLSEASSVLTLRRSHEIYSKDWLLHSLISSLEGGVEELAEAVGNYVRPRPFSLARLSSYATLLALPMRTMAKHYAHLWRTLWPLTLLRKGSQSASIKAGSWRFMVKHGIGFTILIFPIFLEQTRTIFYQYKGFWGIITYFIVFQQTLEGTIKKSILRLLGTLVGVGVGIGVTFLSTKDPILAAGVLFVSAFFGAWLGQHPKYGYGPASPTIS